MRAAAEQSHLTVLWSQVHGLVEPHECLIRLVPRQLDGADALADLGVQRIELEGPEISGEGFIRPAHRLELLCTGEVGLGVVRLDLDGQLKSLEG